MKFDFKILWTTKSNKSVSQCKCTFSENWLTTRIANIKIKWIKGSVCIYIDRHIHRHTIASLCAYLFIIYAISIVMTYFCLWPAAQELKVILKFKHSLSTQFEYFQYFYFLNFSKLNNIQKTL